MDSPSTQRSSPLVQLPLVYLDWNIFDGISKGEFPELQKLLFIARDEGIIHIPYTEWHLYEAANVSPDVRNHLELVARNINAMRESTDLVCIWDYAGPPGWQIMRFPLESVFDIATTQKLVTISEIFKPILAAFTVVKDKLISYGLVPGTLNKFEPNEVVEEINKILLKPENLEKYEEYAPDGITLEEIIDLSVKLMPDSTNELHRMAAIYFLIDQIGYYSDKSVKKRVMSLWRDGMHVAWASRTQVLISNDERLRMKARLTYQMLGVSTVVLDPIEAIDVIAWMINNGDQLKAEYELARMNESNVAE